MARSVGFLDNRYNISITPEARAQIEIYCDSVNTEIGWLASVEQIEGVGFVIDKCYLLKQKVHGATTELDPMAMVELWSSLSEEGQAKIKCWGHSHVNMSPTPSGQDNEQMGYFKDGNPWFIRLITNKKREYYIDIFDWANGLRVHIDGDDLKDYNPAREEMEESIKAEIKEKVSRLEYTTTTTTSTYKGLLVDNVKKEKDEEEENEVDDIKIATTEDLDDVYDKEGYWNNDELIYETILNESKKTA